MPSRKSIPLLEIETKKIKDAEKILRTVYHPFRIEIIKLIHQEEKMIVSKIVQAFGLEKAIISIHLRKLREAGAVVSERAGNYVYYQLNYSFLDRLGQLTAKLVGKRSSARGKQLVLIGNDLLRTRNNLAFSTKELRIIEMICEEYPDENIARVLSLQPGDMQTYKTAIFKKMKVKSTAGLVVFAIKEGLFALR